LAIFCQKDKGEGVGVVGGKARSFSTGVEVGEGVELGLDSEGVTVRLRVEPEAETTPLTEDLVLAESQFDQGPVAQPLPARTEK